MLPVIEWVALASVIAVILALMSSYPVLFGKIPCGHDTDFHLARIESICLGLGEGVFPVRLYEAQAYGMGYPCGLCYPDMFLYLPALLRLCGISMRTSYALFVLVANVATAGIALFSFTRMFGSRSRGAICSVLWALAPYRLYDVLVRASIGEYLAMAFMPLMLCGIWSLRHADDREWSSGHLWLGAAMAGIANSHMLSLPVSMALCVPFAVHGLVARRDIWARQLLQVAKAVVVALVLCAGFALPFLSYYSQHDLLVQQVQNHPQGEALSIAQLLTGFLPFQVFRDPERLFSHGFPIQTGLALLGGLGGALMASVAPSLLGRRKPGKSSRPEMILTAVVALGLMLLTTSVFPWDRCHTDGIMGALASPLAVIQFPWRLLAQVSLVLATLWGLLLTHDDVPLIRRLATVAVAVALVECQYATGSFMGVLVPLEGYDDLSLSHVSNGEYLPASMTASEFNAGEVIKEPVTSSEELSVTVDSRSAQSFRIGIRNASETEQTALLPLLWHEELTVDDDRVSIEGDGGLVRMTVPAGYDRAVEIRFVEPVSWRVAEAVTVLGTLALSVMLAGHTVARRRGRAVPVEAADEAPMA